MSAGDTIMRPVDMQPRTPHPLFNATFDNLTGAPLMIMSDTIGFDAQSVQVNDHNWMYHFFRINQTFGPNLLVAPPEPADLTIQNATQAIMPVYPMPVWTAAPLNFDGTGTLQVNAQLLWVQLGTRGKARTKRLRMLLPASQALDLLRVAKEDNWNRGPAPSNQLMVTLAKKILERVEMGETAPQLADRVEGKFFGYRGAMRELVQTIGRYCSYCECRGVDGDTFQLEHRLAKAAYPSEWLRWENFLLACAYCNQAKNPQPNRETGIELAIRNMNPLPEYNGGKAAPFVPRGQNQNRLPYHAMRKACEDEYLWPSSDDAPNNPAPTNYSLRCLKYKLIERTPQGPRDVPVRDSVRLENLDGEDDAFSQYVIAQVWNSTTNMLESKHVLVVLQPKDPGTLNVALNAHKRDAARRTIRMCNLNWFQPAEQDRRANQRTHTWFKAIEALAAYQKEEDLLGRVVLSGQLTQQEKDEHLRGLWDKLVAGPAEAGYFSVWLTVFLQAGGQVRGEALVNALNTRGTGSNLDYRYRGWSFMNSVYNQIPDML
jgi:hypothetical protein